MHYWGDEGVDWEGISDAADFLGDYCCKWGRFGGDTKEKFGRACFYARFGLSLHQLIYPRFVYFKHRDFPDWLWKWDIYYISPVLNKLFGKPWAKYQEFIYRKAYEKALAKWPHLKKEILYGADYPELLEGLGCE